MIECIYLFRPKGGALAPWRNFLFDALEHRCVFAVVNKVRRCGWVRLTCSSVTFIVLLSWVSRRYKPVLWERNSANNNHLINWEHPYDFTQVIECFWNDPTERYILQMLRLPTIVRIPSWTVLSFEFTPTEIYQRPIGTLLRTFTMALLAA